MSDQSKGGYARAAKLSPERRIEIATKASHARGRQIKPAGPLDIKRVELACQALRVALQQLSIAGCDKSAAKVRLAITSTDGALRHVQRRASAQETT